MQKVYTVEFRDLVKM